MKSSSLHGLNADRGLPPWGRRLWYALNWLNNSILPNRKSNKIEIRKFAPQLSAEAWAQVEPKSSPSRALSDLFWMQLPWQRIQAALGEIRILDTGCGSGRYGIQLQNYSGGRVTNYTGLDERPHAEWPQVMKEHPFIKLLQADSASFAKSIPESTNLFISQSAIEHFPEDLTYFRQLRDFIAQGAKPALQVHLFPAAACLRLYRFHGVRQYTPRTVSLIAGLFPESEPTLFELGGPACNALHWEFITKPVLVERKADGRDTEPDEYARQLRAAIEKGSASQGQPSFYALVTQTRSKTSLF